MDAKSTANLATDVGKIVDKLISDTNNSGQIAIFLEKKQLLLNQAKSLILAANSLSSQPTSMNEQNLSLEQEKLNKIISDIRLLESEYSTRRSSISEGSTFADGLSIPALDNGFSADDIDTSFLYTKNT